MAILTDRIAQATELVQMISEIIVAPILILFAGLIVGKLLRNITYKFATSIQLNTLGKNKFGYTANYAELLAGGLAAITYTITVVYALVVANIITYTLWTIVGFLGMFGVLAMLLGLRDFWPDLWAGRKVRRKIQVGDKFACGGVRGKVEKIGLLDVRIMNTKREVYSIPHRTAKKSI